MRNAIRILVLTVSLALSVGVGVESFAQQRKPKSTQTQTSRKSPSAKKGNTKVSKKTTKKKASSKRKTSKPETAEQMQRRQSETQKEIKRTQEQIRQNEQEVKKGLGELNRLAAGIETARKQVALTQQQIDGLDVKIAALDQEINESEQEIERLRQKYLAAVKKMRGKKSKQSDIAFVFSSNSLSQAMRRMRYLKEFSQWKDKQSSEISDRLEKLQAQAKELERAKSDKDIALRQQRRAQSQLSEQHSRQDAVVINLRKNGDALRSHLMRKQNEANDLKGKIAAAIAAEQRRAEQQRAEEQRREQEAQKSIQVVAEDKKGIASNTDGLKSDNPIASKTNVTETKGKKKSEKKIDRKGDKKSSEKKNYAEARGRQPRATESSSTASVSKGSQTASSGNFEAAKGRLPRPVSGPFRVTSQFGRHPLPELPDVMYDNPGIDAEVSANASAMAVFVGKVTGVYKIPGYNTVVIVNHGNYYTVYGNLASVGVKIGDAVKQGQTLGHAGMSEDGDGYSIHFEVWKNRDKLNPLEWIGR